MTAEITHALLELQSESEKHAGVIRQIQKETDYTKQLQQINAFLNNWFDVEKENHSMRSLRLAYDKAILLHNYEKKKYQRHLDHIA